MEGEPWSNPAGRPPSSTTRLGQAGPPWRTAGGQRGDTRAEAADRAGAGGVRLARSQGTSAERDYAVLSVTPSQEVGAGGREFEVILDYVWSHHPGYRRLSQQVAQREQETPWGGTAWRVGFIPKCPKDGAALWEVEEGVGRPFLPSSVSLRGNRG